MGRLFRLTATIIAMIVVGLIGCSEQGTELPVTSGGLSMNPDSIALREARASGGFVEFGPARTHGTNGTNSDTMYLEAPSGFRVELVDSECGGTNVVMRVVNPVDSLLGTAMCQQSVPSVWDFPGPYPAGTGIVLNVIPNFMTAVGEFRIKNGYPSWRVEVEAGLDQDFNDLVFDITPLADTTDIRCDQVTRGQETTCEVLATVDSVVEWRWVGITSPGTVTDTVRSAVDTTQWVGLAVGSGAVEVDAVVGGNPVTLTPTTLVVDPRPFAWGPTDWSYDSMQAGGICPGDDQLFISYHAGGNTHGFDGILGPGGIQLGRNGPVSDTTADCNIVVEPNVSTMPDSGFSGEPVDDGGPNDGIWYVTAALYRMDRGAHINESIRPGGDSVALQKTKDINRCNQLSPPDTVNFYDYNETCRNQQTDSLIAGIVRHEGYGDPSLQDSLANGHQRRIEIAAAKPENDPARAIEDLITPDGATILSNLVRNKVMAVDDSLYAAADAARPHVYVGNNYSASNWVWDSTTTSSQGEQFNLLPINDSIP